MTKELQLFITGENQKLKDEKWERVENIICGIFLVVSILYFGYYYLVYLLK